MVTQTQTKTEVLSYAERTVIASVLTWDAINKTFSPDEIEAIKIDGDMVCVKLTNGAWPISRHMFCSILKAQRAAINKQIEEVDKNITEVAQTTKQETKKEYLPVFIPLGNYRGWRMVLVSMKDTKLAPHGKYWVEVVNVSSFEKIISKRLFSSTQETEAIAFAKGLIDWERSFCVIDPGTTKLPACVF